MNYKKFKFNEHRPTGKQNCMCWLENGNKIACYYHQKKDAFLIRYGERKGKQLDGVKEWAYAILPKRQSHLFEESLLQLNLTNGDNEFKIQYSLMNPEEQTRLFEEIELIKAAIFNWFDKYA